eukprot:scaffold121591_cov19-Tisochrysis_lutea.AAC.1
MLCLVNPTQPAFYVSLHWFALVYTKMSDFYVSLHKLTYTHDLHTQHGYTPLMVAIMQQDSEAITTLLRMAADIHQETTVSTVESGKFGL